MHHQKIKSMKPLLFFIGFFWALAAFAQNNPVSGTVVAATTHQPLAGATLRWKGTTVISQTDAAGKFTLPATQASLVLIVSHVGYQTKEWKVAQNQTTGLLIPLEEAVLALESITVSNGYESLPKERVTGSFSKVYSALFHRSVS